jgi:hypothetical protein
MPLDIFYLRMSKLCRHVAGLKQRWAKSKVRGNRTWTLDVTDDRSGGVVHELDADLGNTSTGTCTSSDPAPSPFSASKSFDRARNCEHTGSAQNTGDLDELDWDLR